MSMQMQLQMQMTLLLMPEAVAELSLHGPVQVTCLCSRCPITVLARGPAKESNIARRSGLFILDHCNYKIIPACAGGALRISTRSWRRSVQNLSVRQRRHRLDSIHPPHGLVVRCQHIAPQQAEEAAARTLAIAAIALRLHPRCGRGAILDVSCRMCRPCIGRGPTIVAVAQLWDTNDHLVLTHAWLADRLHVDALVRSLGEHVLVGHTHTRARTP